METVTAQSAGIIQEIGVRLGFGPLFPLFLFGIVTFSAVAIGAYIVATARIRAEGRAALLRGEIDAITERLNEAQRIGKYGSFLWNFDNPTASFWSEEMFNLSGLVKRKNAPSIDSMIGAMYEADREKTRNAWDAAKKKSGPFSFTYRTRSLTGEMRYVRVEGITTLTTDKRPYSMQGVVRDVTKEMEVDKAKTEFVSLASHQLKTPLTTVRWHCEAMLSGATGPLSPDQTKYIQTMQEANLRMIGMVNDLLNISRIELNTFSLRPEEFDIRELAQSVIAEQEKMAQDKQVTLRFSSSEVPRVFADKTMARMIFQNLISNAIKYTPTGGSVECEIGTAGAKKESIFIRIADTGIGIPKGEQHRVFEKLHRASNAEALVPDGTGLGLYVVKMIVDHAGGGITFESVEGKGTTFYVSLPFRWLNAEGRAQPRSI